MDIELAVGAYAMYYRAYHDALEIYINDRDWEALHELDRARGHLADAVKRLHDMGIKVTLGAHVNDCSHIPEAMEKDCA